MIYLFNSGYANLYQTNALNTLFLPPKWTNEYRYRYKGDSPSIHIEDDKYFQSLNFQNNDPKSVLIIYVNRYGEKEYEFFPLRKGKLVGLRKDGEQLYFKVSLEDYFAPQNITKFNFELKNILSRRPILKNNDPESVDDGFYAVFGKDIQQVVETESDEQSNIWERVVKSIESLDSFEHAEEYLPIFSKLLILDSQEKPVHPKLYNGNPIFHFIVGSEYSLRFRYYYPRFKENSFALVRLNFGEGLIATGQNLIHVGNQSNSEVISFIPRKNFIQTIGSFRFEIDTSLSLMNSKKLFLPFKLGQGFKYAIKS